MESEGSIRVERMIQYLINHRRLLFLDLVTMEVDDVVSNGQSRHSSRKKGLKMDDSPAIFEWSSFLFLKDEGSEEEEEAWEHMDVLFQELIASDIINDCPNMIEEV